MVGIGIVGNLAGYPILDPIAALIVGFMVAKMGWALGWDALHDLMDRPVVKWGLTRSTSTARALIGRATSGHNCRPRAFADIPPAASKKVLNDGRLR